MDFSSIAESVKEKITNLTDTVSEKVSDLMETNKTLFFALLGMIFAIVLCLILLIVVISNGKANKDKNKGLPPVTVMGTETPVIPDAPKLPKDYNISRPAKDRWTKEESEEWFTVPGEKEIDSLSFSNDKIVNDILEAAP